MLTYQVRPRVFRLDEGQELSFPADCVARFHFMPAQPFGTTAHGGRTVVRAAPAEVLLNANTGQHYVESKTPLSPLDVTIEEPIRLVHLTGQTLTISQRVETLRELEEMILSVFFGMPVLLNLNFADPPFVSRVDGEVGSSSFRWELKHWQARFRTTTQADQEQGFITAWDRMDLLSAPNRRRLLAALHYFHVACRLAREAETAGEFVAEVILNLAKVLEVLFPPEGDGQTRDAARRGLMSLGFSNGEIEACFLPAMALRNELDVAHVELGLFTTEQLAIIHAYTEQAEEAFRRMLSEVLRRLETGSYECPAHDLRPPRKRVVEIVNRLRKSMREEPAPPDRSARA